MAFLTPLALLAGLLAIPIILLYMLRLRRREIVISSTFLWQQILQDSEANTPWQRLRRNLLLLLQLLILAALVLALARPFVTVPAVGTGQIVLLLDASASMQATDMDGRSRFEIAKDEALNVVSTLGATDTMTVLRVAQVPEIIAPATNDRLSLRAAINSAQASNASANWNAALTLAIGSAIDSEDFNLVIISDGGLGDPALLPDVPGEVSYIPVGESSSNLAITALATRARAGQAPQLFTQITNYGAEDAEIVYSLTIDGDLFVSDFYTVPAQDNIALVSERLPENFNLIEAALTIPAASDIPDFLEADNRAWAVANSIADRAVLLMSPGNIFVEQMLQSLPAVEGFRGDLERGIPRQQFDLYILDRWLPETLPDGDLLFINPPESRDLFTVGPTIEDLTSITVLRNDPRTQFLDFDSVNILEYSQISDVGWATPLVSAGDDPLVLVGEIDGRQVAILSFDIHNTDLPLQISWPVLMANLMDWFSPQTVISTSDLTVGDLLTVRPPLSAERVLVTQPDGTQQAVPLEGPSAIFTGTNQIGVYGLEVLQGDTVTQREVFTVNLFDPLESNIQPQSAITLGQTTISSDVRDEIGQVEIWPYVALLGLLLLLLEWYVYQRRQRIPTRFAPVPGRGTQRGATR